MGRLHGGWTGRARAVRVGVAAALLTPLLVVVPAPVAHAARVVPKPITSPTITLTAGGGTGGDGGPASQAEFNYPSALAIDGAGDLHDGCRGCGKRFGGVSGWGIEGDVAWRQLLCPEPVPDPPASVLTLATTTPSAPSAASPAIASPRRGVPQTAGGREMGQS